MRQSKFTETQVVSILKDAMPAATKISMRLPSWRLSRMRDPPAGRSTHPNEGIVNTWRLVDKLRGRGRHLPRSNRGGAIDGVRR
jgi:hypothetical protein